MILILIGYCFVLKVPFLDASRISQYLEARTLFLGHQPLLYACIYLWKSVEDPQGMHQDLMFIPRKGTRRGLASRGKALVYQAGERRQRIYRETKELTLSKS